MSGPIVKWLVPAFVAACLAGCATQVKSTGSPKALEKALKEAERRRDPFAPEVREGAFSQHVELRLLALKILARSEERGTGAVAAPLLGDRNEEVGRWAAFALGQIGDATSRAALIQSLSGVSLTPDQVYLSLGRIGTSTAARRLSVFLSHPEAKLRAASSLAIGLIAKRQVPNLPKAELVQELSGLVKDSDRDVRFAASYALMRLAGEESIIPLIGFLTDEDPEVRANAARGLGAAHAAPPALDPVLRDVDWRVRVEVARALALMGELEQNASSAAQRLSIQGKRELIALTTKDPLASGRAIHVLFAVVESLGSLGTSGQAALSDLSITLKHLKTTAETKPDAARLDCQIALAEDTFRGEARRIRFCGDASIRAWRRWQLETKLLGKLGKADALFRFSAHKDPRVRLAMMEALATISNPALITPIEKYLSARDPAMAALAADALVGKVRTATPTEAFFGSVGAALDRLAKEADPVYVASALDLVAALGKRGAPLLEKVETLRKDARRPVRRRAALAREAIVGEPGRVGTSNLPLPVEPPKPVEGLWWLTLRTRRGDIRIELDADVAPMTAGALVSLTQAGFYNQKTFHRVVSNFVIQGGAERDDGWGGPGFFIEDEVSPRSFVRGAVGIATAGRDTGSTQFFIMHSHHPHLDGGYTWCGRVIGGMDVVDAIQADDVILEATVRPGPTLNEVLDEGTASR